MSAPVLAPLSGNRMRARVGLALLVLAGLCFCLRLAFPSHDRAWSADAVPRASYDLAAGTQYRLSSVEGPSETSAVPLACTIQNLGADNGRVAGGPVQPLALTALTGDRITHDIATFVAPFTGSARILCAGGPAVFVDGAEDIGRDWNAVLVVAGITLGVGGLLLASSAVTAARPETRPKYGPVPGKGDTGTTVEAAPGV